MASNAKEIDDNAPPAVGETIPLGESGANDKQEASAGQGDKEASAPENQSAPDKPPRVRRAKKVGSRILQLRARVADGTASDSDKREYSEWEEKQKTRARASTTPPVDDTPRDGKAKSNDDWTKKYGAWNGRELICASLGELTHGVSMRLSQYIVENGGVPFIDGRNEEESKRWYQINVLAWHELLPPHIEAGPHIMLVVGNGAMAIEAALIASKNKKKKTTPPTPQEEARKAEAERVKSAKDGNPPEEEKPQKKKRERPVDKDGNPVY